MDTQIQSAIAPIPRHCVVREVTEPARVQAWLCNVDERDNILGFTTRQPKLSVQVTATPCGSGAATSLAGSV